MKKDKAKKLTLNKETVRKLNEGDLKQVAGGRSSPCATQPPNCACTHTSAGPSHPIWC